jgi:hypothetical protein
LRIRFVAGSAADIFGAHFVSSVLAELRQRFPSFSPGQDNPYESDSLPATSWRELQSRVGERVPQVSGMDAYQAVYLSGGAPAVIEVVPVPGLADPVHVGGLDALLSELRAFAAGQAWPIEDLELMQLANNYLEDDELFERDLDVQVYVQLMLSARQASARNEALWIVV